MSSRFSSLGKILQISQQTSVSGNPYKKLVIRTDVAFRTKYLKFPVWDDEKLTINGVMFKEGDSVRVTYYPSGKFYKLACMIHVPIEPCPVCFAYNEETDTQKTDCPNCSTLPITEHMKRIDRKATLRASCLGVFQFSRGYCLDFTDDSDWDEKYYCVVYENDPLFTRAAVLVPSKSYTVVGWKNVKIGNHLDITDIY